MAEPQDITRSPSLLVTKLSWAEAGAQVEPSSGRKDSGLLAADLVTKEEFNWLWLEPYRWLRALFSRYLSSGEALVGSWFVDKGTGIWSDDAVGPLQGFLSDGPAGTASLVTDLWLDPNDTGAVRIQVNAAKAFPAQFLANKDTYIFVPIDLIVPPTVSEPELALLDVPVGFGPPATPAGHVLVWRVETDGAGIVDQEIFLPDFPVLKQVGFEIISAAIAMVEGDLDVGGEIETADLTVLGNTALGNDPADTTTITGPASVLGSVTIASVPSLVIGLHVTGAGDAPALVVEGNGNIGATVQTTSSNSALLGQNLGTGQGVFAGATDAGTCGLRAENTAGSAINATGAGSASAIDASTTGTGSAGDFSNNNGAATLVVENTGSGSAADCTSVGGAATLTVEHIGVGRAASFVNNAGGLATLRINNTSGGPGLDALADIFVAAGSKVKFGEGVPSTVAGAVQFDGRALALGDGVTAPRLAAPMLDTVPSVSTGLGIDDTGASKSLNMRTGEDAKIVITATARNTITGVNIVFIADANGASIGNTTSFYEPNAIGGAVQTITRIIRYTHGGADASVTFKAQFGANAGVTHLTDVSIEASHI